MEKLTIVSYELKKCKPKQRVAIQRAINGYKDYSFNQKYKYQRKGILDEIPFKYLNNGVVVVLFKDRNKLLSVLHENKAVTNVLNLYSKGSVLH